MPISQLARALLAVPVVPTGTIRALFATTLAASIALGVGVAPPVGAAAPVLLMHIFASASGFAVTARRGHLDLILTRGATRRRVAILHWCLSIAPGVCCWMLLSMIETATLSSSMLRAPGALAALTLASTVPWALNTRLPRQSGAVAWVVAASLVDGLRVGETMLLGVLTPWRLDASIWSRAGDSSAWALVTITGAAVVVTAVLAIARSDVPLEAAQ